ncbi:MAG TPA: PilZ domain-containing protein [Bryobacteraceae bacterium]
MEKRNHWRFRPQRVVTVTVPGPSPRSISMTVVDLSDDGIGLRSIVPLRTGTQMEIDLNGKNLLAVVERCTSEEGFSLIGASLRR